MAGLDAFLGWVEANSAAYGKLVRSAAAIPEVREIVDGCASSRPGGSSTASTRSGTARPGLRTAVRAWLWFMDGAILDWVEHRDISRDELRGLLLGTLLGAVTASGEGAKLAG